VILLWLLTIAFLFLLAVVIGYVSLRRSPWPSQGSPSLHVLPGGWTLIPL